MINRDKLIRKHKIFVEGKADQVFIRDILTLFYGISLDKKELQQTVYDIEGKDKIVNFAPTFLETKNGKREGGNNLVILDADYYDTNGGYVRKSIWLKELQKQLGIDFEYFLFTNNEGKEGTIESLLETCVHPNHSKIFDCWDGFEKCVTQVSQTYTIPAKKSKIYLYLECLYGKTKPEKEKIKDPNRNFLETDKWNFDIANNGLLNNLKEFFDQHLC